MYMGVYGSVLRPLRRLKEQLGVYGVMCFSTDDGCNLRNPELRNSGIRNHGTMELRNSELRNYGTESQV